MRSTTTPRPHRSTSTLALRAVLVVLGAISAFVAVNVAFGGLETLGLQGPTEYFRITDHDAFALRDSHARFYGGVYLGIAAFLILAATDLRKYRGPLNLAFALIFLGGLARLSQGDAAVTFGHDLTVSSLIELVGMPALALWLTAATRQRPNANVAHTPPTAHA
jgi:hypothetical protein